MKTLLSLLIFTWLHFCPTSTENLKDGHGKFIGKIETSSDCSKKIYDAHSNYLGRYNPIIDITMDKYDKTIGRGDQLMRLLK